MVSDRKEAGLLLSGTALISVAADSRVAAVTGQADVMVVAGGSDAATWLNLPQIGGRDFLYSAV